MTPEQVEQMLAILSLISQQINQQTSNNNLGLRSDFGTLKIYCNRTNGCNWYTLDSENNPIPIQEKGLRGYLVDIKFEEVERRQKKCWKLLTTINADRVYLLESGYETHFTKGLLAAIAVLAPTQLSEPIVVSPVPGSDETVLFCRVYQNNQPVKIEYSDNTDWRAIAKTAIANVKAAQT